MSGYLGIPISYTPVEYIQSSGTQYIDTGIIPSNTFKIETEIARIGLTATDGVCGSTVNSVWGMYFYLANNGKIACAYGNQNVYVVDNTNFADTNKHKYTLDLKSTGLETTVDGTLQSTKPYSAISNGANYYLFKCNDGGSSRVSSVKMYSFKIYDNNVLVRNFIPVVDQDNVACLYDLVGNNIYYNKGSGTFTAGSVTGQSVSIGSRARKTAKAYVGVMQTYTPVEYIESSGTQYIDTGFIPKQDTKIELDAQTTSNTTSNMFAGGRQAWQNNAYCISQQYGDGSNTGYRFAYGTETYDVPNTYQDVNRHVFALNENLAYVDNTLVKTFSTQTFTSPVPMWLFAGNNNGSIQQAAKVKIYSCKIYDGSTLVRDFIPVVDQDNIACLYDLVEGKFYYNKGSGAFTMGNATGQQVSTGGRARRITKGYVGVTQTYTPVEYIESSGSQYIDTKVKTDEVSKIEAVASNTFGLDYQGIGYGNSCFGARIGASDSNFQYANGAYNEFVGNGTSQLSLARNTSSNILTISYSKTSYDVTSTDYNISGSLNVTISTPLNIYMFALNNNGTAAGGTWKIYSLKMYGSSNNVIRDFVPVTDENNIACLWEKVEEKAYYNKGSGTFTAGSTTGASDIKVSKARLFYNLYDYGDGSYNNVSNGYVGKMYLNGTALSSSGPNYYNGNFDFHFVGQDNNTYSAIVSSISNTADVFRYASSTNIRFSSGTGTYTIGFDASTEEKTCTVAWTGNGRTSGQYFKNLKFNCNGTFMTLQEMVTSNIIKPLVIISSAKNENNSNYRFANVLNMYTGGQTDNKSYANIDICFMVNAGNNISQVQFYANVAAPSSSVTTVDGFGFAMGSTKNTRLTLNSY